MKSILLGSVGFAWALALFWISGIDLLDRGFWAGCAFFYGSLAAAFAVIVARIVQEQK